MKKIHIANTTFNDIKLRLGNIQAILKIRYNFMYPKYSLPIKSHQIILAILVLIKLQLFFHA